MLVNLVDLIDGGGGADEMEGDQIRIDIDESQTYDTVGDILAAEGLTVDSSSGDTVFTDSNNNDVFVLENYDTTLSLDNFDIV